VTRYSGTNPTLHDTGSEANPRGSETNRRGSIGMSPRIPADGSRSCDPLPSWPVAGGQRRTRRQKAAMIARGYDLNLGPGDSR
jgi:hypothetical protein